MLHKQHKDSHLWTLPRGRVAGCFVHTPLLQGDAGSAKTVFSRLFLKEAALPHHAHAPPLGDPGKDCLCTCSTKAVSSRFFQKEEVLTALCARPSLIHGVSMMPLPWGRNGHQKMALGHWSRMLQLWIVQCTTHHKSWLPCQSR